MGAVVIASLVATATPASVVAERSATADEPTTTTTTTEPRTEVAGKVVERAPAKVLADSDVGDGAEMPRTGSSDPRLLAGVGWLLLGMGLLLVDATRSRVSMGTRRRP